MVHGWRCVALLALMGLALTYPPASRADDCEEGGGDGGSGSEPHLIDVPQNPPAAPVRDTTGSGSETGGGTPGKNLMLENFHPTLPTTLAASMPPSFIYPTMPTPPGDVSSIEPSEGCEDPSSTTPDPTPTTPPPTLSCGSMVASKQCNGTTLSSTVILLNANACRDWCAATNLSGGTCCGFVLLGTACKVTNGAMAGNILPVNLAASCTYQ